MGQARPLRVFGIFISQARAQQEALIETQKESVKQLTNAELVQARYNIILRDSVIAQGDFDRTSGSLANQQRILSAQLSNVAVEIGQVLIPAVLLAIRDINLLIEGAQRLGKIKINIPGTEEGGSLDILRDKLRDVFGERGARLIELNAIAPGLGFMVNSVTLLDKALKALVPSEKEAQKGMDDLNHAMVGGAKAAHEAVLAFAAAQRALKSINTELQGLDVQRLEIQTGLAPGGRGAEEANLRKQIAADKQAVAAAKSGTAARKQALADLKADQDDLARLLEEDAADAKDRAQRIEDASRAQEQAAKEAAQAQADATQTFIDAFSGRRGRIEQRLTSAQLFGTAKTQIALNKLIIQADKAEIEAIQDRIRHLHLHGDALKLAQRTIEELNQEIFNTRNAILQLQSSRKQALADARQSHLEAQLSIAETTASTADDRAAQKALIAFDQVQIRRILAIKRRRRLTVDEAAQLDAYRVDLAQRNAAIKKTQEEQKKGSQLQQSMFNFLQTQQGFAANLLGNLIPGFATRGLVGNASTAASGPAAGAGFPGALSPEEHGFGVQGAAAVAGSRGATVRPVQVDTTNQLLRQILGALQGKKNPAPETVYNRYVATSLLDIY